MIDVTGRALKVGNARGNNTFKLFIENPEDEYDVCLHLDICIEGPGQSQIWTKNFGNGTVGVNYRCPVPGDYLIHITYQILTRNCSKLKKLVIGQNSWLVDDHLVSVFQNNLHLSHIELTGSLSLSGNCLHSLAVCSKELAVLILSESSNILGGALEQFCLQQHERTFLTQIDVSSCTLLTKKSIITLATTFPGLKKLSLAHLSCVDDDTLLVIGRQCQNLVYLDIRGCTITNYGVRCITEYCRNLQTFLVNCSQITERSLCLLQNRENISTDVRPIFPYGVQV